jgi:hypothetical protein
MKCRRLERELACLRLRISPAHRIELQVRCCDVCPVGSSRARSLANHAKKVAALEMAFGATG